MPTAEQILFGLREVANNWRTLAIFWHAYFGALAIALIMGIRPAKRLTGFLLALPLFSVSIIAWAHSSPFNGIVFALAGILFFSFSARLPREKAQTAPIGIMVLGVILFLFGWVYPHFLDTPSFLPYLYASPTGLIPCPTLFIVIGVFLILNGLGSRALSLILGLSGLFFGVIGAFQLRVSIDTVLSLGASLTLVFAFAGIRPRQVDRRPAN